MEYVDEINDKDILCGRGSRSNLHPGNKAYLKLVEIWRQRYKSTRHIKVKKAIILEIMNILQSNNVRFLELDSTNNRWYVLHERTTYKKIAQRLRDPPSSPTKKTFKGLRQPQLEWIPSKASPVSYLDSHTGKFFLHGILAALQKIKLKQRKDLQNLRIGIEYGTQYYRLET